MRVSCQVHNRLRVRVPIAIRRGHMVVTTGAGSANVTYDRDLLLFPLIGSGPLTDGAWVGIALGLLAAGMLIMGAPWYLRERRTRMQLKELLQNQLYSHQVKQLVKEHLVIGVELFY